MGQSVERKMRALYFEKTGALSNLQVRDLPLPVPKDGEALVQVKAAAINPSDIGNVLGRFPFTTLPRVPGRDFSGVVLKGSSSIVGREVFGTGGNLGFGRDGSHAEMLCVPEEALSLKPSAWSYAQAAASGVAFLTAWQAVVNAGRLQPGETLLIIGAGGIRRLHRLPNRQSPGRQGPGHPFQGLRPRKGEAPSGGRMDRAGREKATGGGHGPDGRERRRPGF